MSSPQPTPKSRSTTSPPLGTGYCRACDRRWRSLSQAHCAACHAHFAGTAAFDKHRVGFACVDPATLTNAKTGNPVMAQGGDGIWSRWTDPAKPHPWAQS